MTPARTSRVLNQPPRVPRKPSIRKSRVLTPRELEIYRMIVEEAASTRDFATRLGITYDTAKRHRSNILNKVGADNSIEMIVWHYTKLKEQQQLEAGGE